MGNIATDEVDPIAEADVYLAYGRDEQAEEILKDAIIKHPGRNELKEKLLEIYSQRGDVGAFETLAEELYASLEGKGGELWDRVAGMGSTLSPSNPMFQGGAPASAAAPASEPAAPVTEAIGESEFTQPATEAMSSMEDTGTLEMDDALSMTQAEPDMGAEPTQAIDLGEMQAEAMSPEIEMDTGLDLGTSASEEPEVVSDEELGGLEFNLDIGSETDAGSETEDTEMAFGSDASSDTSLDFEPSGVSLSGEPEAEAEPELSMDEGLSLDSNEISMESTDESGGLSMDEEDEFASLRQNTAANNETDLSISIGTDEGEPSFDDGDMDTSLDMSDMSLDADDSGLSFGTDSEEDVAVAVAPEVEEVGAGDGSAEQWDEAATKLDLAKAYIDMGDAEGAKSILEEVAVEGNDDQKRQAAELAGQIG
jgi:pilus assembly protein FimV